MAEFDEGCDPPPDHVRRLMDDVERRKAPAAAQDGKPEKIGYRSPPKARRYQPGQSGNPKGRPPQQKRFQALVRDVFDQKVKITENGRTKKVTVTKLVLTQLSRKAAKGDHRAIKEFVRLLERIQPLTPEPLVSKEDMDERLARATGRFHRRRPLPFYRPRWCPAGPR